MFLATLFTIAKTWMQTKCPLIDEIIKMWYIYSMEYYLSIKENEILTFETMWKDLQYSVLVDLIQVEKDRCTMLCLIYVI